MKSSIILPLIMLIPLGALMLNQLSLLASLLSLEMTMLMIVLIAFMKSGSSLVFNPSLSLLLLSLSACEAAIGLSLLVSLLRSFGKEAMFLMTNSKC